MATTINIENIAKIYVATFNRAPDQDGLDYWVNHSGLSSLEEIAMSFFDQTETQTIYTPQMTTTQKVTLAYQNLFNRTPDQEGLNYWVQQIDTGIFSQSAMLIALLNGSQGDDVTILTNKTQVGLYFAEHNLNSPADASSVLSGITANSDTVTTSYAHIDTLAESANLLLTNALELRTAINTVGTLASATTFGVATLDTGNHWSGDDVTYSFNITMPAEYNGDWYSSQWNALNTIQQTTVRTIMSEINSLLDINLHETYNNDGQIRFNIANSGYSGFSNHPGTLSLSGDIFLSPDFNISPDLYSLDQGDAGWHIIVHELGHAFGFKHPFQGEITLPTSLDDRFHSVMSYTYKNDLFPSLNTSNGINLSFNYVYPQLYSLYDIAALQAIYGSNLTTHTGNDTYTVNSLSGEIITIWDAGGEDTIDLSSSLGKSTIDLSSGSLNSGGLITVAERISLLQNQAHASGYYDNDAWIYDSLMHEAPKIYTGKNNLGIATGTIIENLKTGVGDDVIRDNLVNNKIYAGAGNDKIYLGAGGFDTIDGEAGLDTIYIDIALANLEYAKIANDTYRFIGDDFAADVSNVEYVVCVDGIVRDMTFFI